MHVSVFDSGPLATVRCMEGESRPSLVLEKDFVHSPARLWAVLTVPELIEQWAPFRPDHALDAAGPVNLRMEGPDKDAQGQAVWIDTPGSVVCTRAEMLLAYTWGEDDLSWALQALPGSATRLTLTHSIASREWLPKMAAGWHLCLRVAEHLLDGHPIRRIVGMEARKFGWDDLHDAYAARLGITPTAFPEERKN